VDVGSLGRDFLLFSYPLSEKGEGRNRTKSSPTTSLNIPDLQGNFNIDFTGVQAVSDTILLNPPPTRHTPAAYSVIEEIVEGFVEGFGAGWNMLL
jgi:hypothetical protein